MKLFEEIDTKLKALPSLTLLYAKLAQRKIRKSKMADPILLMLLEKETELIKQAEYEISQVKIDIDLIMEDFSTRLAEEIKIDENNTFCENTHKPCSCGKPLPTVEAVMQDNAAVMQDNAAKLKQFFGGDK